jgi:hypothetical protein
VTFIAGFDNFGDAKLTAAAPPLLKRRAIASLGKRFAGTLTTEMKSERNGKVDGPDDIGDLELRDLHRAHPVSKNPKAPRPA